MGGQWVGARSSIAYQMAISMTSFSSSDSKRGDELQLRWSYQLGAAVNRA